MTNSSTPLLAEIPTAAEVRAVLKRNAEEALQRRIEESQRLTAEEVQSALQMLLSEGGTSVQACIILSEDLWEDHEDLSSDEMLDRVAAPIIRELEENGYRASVNSLDLLQIEVPLEEPSSL